MTQVELIWITPNAEQVIVDCARVSNPKNQGKDGTKLIKYLIKHKHWSPFEMASACFSIKTSRAISRQILRHRSFSFQEFSQRYATVEAQVGPMLTKARLSGATNRQSSLHTDDDEIIDAWQGYQENIWNISNKYYQEALNIGIAPELARNLLPEGLTPSHLYMAGTIRSWIHYCQLRTSEDTQEEHRLIAIEIASILSTYLPHITRDTLITDIVY